MVARLPVAGPQQVGHGGIRPVLHEVADSVPAVGETTGCPVDVAECCFRGRDALETG